ncbi:Protein CBG22597 [Caenorhabditis briggsae]|uniref:Protein CBG22597 n=1 Tax=Caenorhabditis briggsae TaxID=6238 RepID=A8Y2K9_CAEBR|nr:Protein CBG22597 [Caenorhabditis briggsae]CAP39133.2 Protein CBG22597 [Caenorhabditis briggsae]
MSNRATNPIDREPMVAPERKKDRVTPMELKKLEVAPCEQKKQEEGAPKEEKKADGEEVAPKSRRRSMEKKGRSQVATIGGEKLHFVVVDTNPYTFANPAPLQYYKVKDNKLVKTTVDDLGSGISRKPKKGKGKKRIEFHHLRIHKGVRTPRHHRSQYSQHGMCP